MKKIITCSTLLLLCNLISAQTPGYLGKRLFMKAEGVTMISMGPTSKNKGLLNTTGIRNYVEDGTSLGLDYQVGVSIGYAFSRLKGWSISANYLKTGMEMEARIFENELPPAFYQLKGYTIAIGRIWWKRRAGAIAPFGNYFGMHLQTTLLRGTFDEKISGYSFVKENPLGFEPKAKHLSLGLEFGQHSVKKDKFLLNYALQLNIPFIFFPRSIEALIGESYLNYYDDYKKDNADSFRLSAKKRMFSHNLLGVKIGFGMLH